MNEQVSPNLESFLIENGLKAKLVPKSSELLLDAIFVKSLVWQVKSSGQCVVLVLFAEDRVDSSLVAAALSVHGAKGRADVGLASRSVAIEASGFPLGCVPPVGHRKHMPVVLDKSLVNMLEDSGQRYFCGGGGEEDLCLLISLNQLLKLNTVSICPVAKVYQDNFEYYVLLNRDGMVLKSSFKNNLQVTCEEERVEKRVYHRVGWPVVPDNISVPSSVCIENSIMPPDVPTLDYLELLSGGPIEATIGRTTAGPDGANPLGILHSGGSTEATIGRHILRNKTLISNFTPDYEQTANLNPNRTEPAGRFLDSCEPPLQYQLVPSFSESLLDAIFVKSLIWQVSYYQTIRIFSIVDNKL